MQQQEMASKQRRMKKRILPPEVSQLAEVSRLGKFTVCYTFTDYTTDGCLLTLFFSVLSVLFFSAGILLAFYLIRTGLVILIIILLEIGEVPLLGLAYLTGKKALKASNGDTAYVYFYQQGLVYFHEEQRIVLRWEQIERVDRIYSPGGHCQVALADSENILLINGGRSLYEEIRRRVIRYRKKYQHDEKPAQ